MTPLTARAGAPAPRSSTLAAAALGLACAGGALLPGPAGGQVVTGSLTQRDTGEPVDGAMISLLDPAGRSRDATLTDGAGRFRFLSIRPGRYLLRADRIGQAPSWSDTLVVAPGDTLHVRMRADVAAISLEGLRVEGERRCTVRPEEGEATARLWDEARKALEAATLTQREGLYRYEMVRYTRDLDREGRRVEREQRRRMAGYRETPFDSHPAEKLVNEGFVEPDPDGRSLYYGPGAQVLLSDLFLDSHCMRIARGDDDRETEGLVGLEFEPVDDRDVPDIRGTLWLEPETSQLQWLDYRYTNLHSLGMEVPTDRLGGKVIFDGLPDGTWIIREWWIRMPRIGLQQREFAGGVGQRQVLLGLREVGGIVRTVRAPGGGVVLATESGTVSGTVVDSTGTRPMEAASVRLAGTDREAVTDQQGTFRFSELDDGVYRLEWSHHGLDTLGLVPQPRTVTVERGEITRVRLQAPTRATMLARRCLAEEDERPRDAGVLLGRVVDPASGEGVPGATVRIRWSGWSFQSRLRGDSERRRDAATIPGAYSIGQEEWETSVTTDADGRYLTCMVPVDHPLTVDVRLGPVSSPPADARIPRESRALRHVFELRLPGGVRTGGHD